MFEYPEHRSSVKRRRVVCEGRGAYRRAVPSGPAADASAADAPASPAVAPGAGDPGALTLAAVGAGQADVAPGWGGSGAGRGASVPAGRDGSGAGRASVPAVLQRLQTVAAELRDLDPGGLSADELAASLSVLAGAGGAVAAAESRLIAAAAASKLHERDGAAGPTEWLKQTFGVSGRQAKRRSELASGLRRLERTADALAGGEITVEHAEQIARSAKKGALGAPHETENRLLDAARRHDADRFRAEVTRRELAADRDALRRDEARAYARRRASMGRADDGMWDLHARLDPVNGEYVKTALDAMTTPDPPDTPFELRRRPEQRTADGLVALARAALEAGEPPIVGKVRPHVTVVVPWETIAPVDAQDRSRVPDLHSGHPGLRGGVDHIVTPAERGTSASAPVRGAAPVEPEFPLSDPVPPAARHEASVAGRAPASPVGEAAWSGPLSVEAIRRLSCDAGIARVVTRGASQVLDAGREERNWSGAQRRAIVARDGHCRFPGCDRPAAWCEIHHVTFWADGGPTDLDNGVLLCAHHHHRCHEGGWTLGYDPSTGQVAVTSPDGRRVLTSRPAGVAARPDAGGVRAPP